MHWDGRDDGGSRVSGGLYFMRLSFEGEVRTGKVVRVE